MELFEVELVAMQVVEVEMVQLVQLVVDHSIDYVFYH